MFFMDHGVVGFDPWVMCVFSCYSAHLWITLYCCYMSEETVNSLFAGNNLYQKRLAAEADCR